MADFDRNLNPIIKTDTSKRLPIIPVGPVKNIPVPGVALMQFSNSNGVSDLSQGEDVFTKLNRLTQQGENGPTPIGVDFKTLQENQRYRTFNPTIENQEDFAAYGQTSLDQAANGLLKGLNLAATTVAGGFATLGGAGRAILPGGKLSDIWDNPFHNALDEWNEKVDNQYLPNYYTQKSTDAEWYETDNWLTTNFLFDKLIKNSGFAVGAMVGGNIANTVLLKAGAAIGRAASAGAALAESAQAFKLFTPLLRNTARAFSAGGNLEAAAILESRLSSIADITGRSNQLAQLGRNTSMFAGLNDATRRTAIALYASGGEAAFEALHTGKEMRATLIDNYITENGSEPIGDDLKEIESQVAQAGKTAFLGNMALLAATEYVQLPFLLGSSYSSSRRTANSLLGEVDDVALREGVYGAANIPTKFGKLYQGIKRVGMYVFDPKEGAQEIGQFALAVGTQNYFEKASKSNDADIWVDGLMYGLTGVDERGEGVGAFNSKEGIEGGILGAITGGLMQASRNYVAKRDRAANTASFTSMLNNAPAFKTAYQDKLQAVNRGIVLQQEQQAAILAGDRQESIDLEADMTFNYLSPRIKYGRFDMVMEDINDLRTSSLTKEGLAELQQQGLANINDTVSSFARKIDSLAENASAINDLYQSINLRYSGVRDENKNRLYSPLVIDKMVYASAKIANYDKRIPMLTSDLSLSGIITSDITSSISKQNKPDREAVNKALNQINDLDTTSEVKDNLKLLLTDTIELSMRRKMFMNEYDQIKNNPLNFERVAQEDQESSVDVAQKDVSTPVKLEVGKTYSLAEPLRLENGKIILAPKIKINATTLGNEYEVTLPDGSSSFLSPEQFDKYNITDVENQSQEFEDLINKAIDDVFNYTTYKDLQKPTGNKLQYLNNLEDPKLASEVYDRFNKLAEDIFKAREERKKAEALLAKNSDAINRQQAALSLDSGEVASPETPQGVQIDGGEEGKKKETNEFHSATITESEQDNDPGQSALHIIRSRIFLNRAGTFKNRDALRAIPFTITQEASLGLSGIIRTSYGVPVDTFNSKVFQDELIDENKGFVGAVFVEKADNGKLHYIDQNGKRIGEVGKPVDISQVIFQTMATTSPIDGRKRNRYRDGQEEQFKAYAEAWRKRRVNLFSSSQIENYPFDISRGIAITEEGPDGRFIRNNVSVMGLSDSVISNYEGLLKVSTLGTISHQGKNKNIPVGLTVLQHEDILEILSNNKLGKKKAENIYNVIKSLTDEILDQSSKGKTVELNPAYISYLQNVLFYKDVKGGVPTDNHFWVNATSISLGKQTYPISEIASNQTQIVNQLADTYHAINSKTLSKKFSDPFFEYEMKDGQLKTKRWKNYQTYLLSGKDRTNLDTPLVTNVAAPTEAIPYTHKAKYAILNNMNLDVEIVKQPVQPTAPVPAPAPITPVVPPVPSTGIKVGQYTIDGKTINDYAFKAGVVEFTALQNKEGNFSVTIVDSDATKTTVGKLVQNPTVLTAAKSVVDKPETLSDEEIIALFSAKRISQEIKDLYNSTVSKSAEKVPEPPQASVVPSTESESPKETPIDKSKFKNRGDDPVYRRVGTGDGGRITEREIELFKTWHAENVSNIPYQIAENVLVTHDNKTAWGVFENGVAKFYKGAIKGTEYHEIFEGIWKAFLSSSEQNALLEDFRNQSGEFTDRETGKSIPYINATDNQARERIADDFADFRTAKIKASSLGDRIVQFFRDIINFVKSFVNKPSLKDQLFAEIEKGRFKDSVVSPEVILGIDSRYSRIPGVSETEANEFVQDMATLIRSYIFDPSLDDKESLYKVKNITSDDVYNFVIGKYSEFGQYQELGKERFDSLYKRTADFMRTLGVNLDEEAQVSINDQNTNQNDYARKPFSTDWKKHSKFAVKFALATLPQTSNQLDSNGIPITQKSSIGGNMLANFSKTFATLLDKLSNSTLGSLDKKLHNLVKTDGNYARLFAMIKGNLKSGVIDFESFTNTDWRFFIQFYQTFTKQKPDNIIQFIDVDGSSYSSTSDQFSESKRMVRDWFENFKQLARGKDPLLKYNSVNKEYEVKLDSVKFPKKKPSNPSESVEFLEALGIKFSIEDYMKLSEKKRQGHKKSDRNIFADNVSSIYTYLGKSEGVYSLNGKTLGISGPLNSLASLKIRATNPNQDNTLLNIEGKRVQKYADNNAVSVLENEFNEADTIEELLLSRQELNDVYSTNSVILQRGGKFFNEDGKRTDTIKISSIQGTLDANSKGTSTSNLTKGQRFTQEINQNLNGDYYILIPADSSTEWMINLGVHGTFEFTNTSEGWEEVYDIFNEYLKDEIALALDYRTRGQLEFTREVAKELRMFKDILPADMISEINNLVSDDSSTDEINNYLTANQTIINDSVRGMLLSEVEKVKNLLIQNGEVTVIPSENETLYSYPHLDSEFADKHNLNTNKLTENQLTNILLHRTSNYAISNIELHKILFGDPYQFKTTKGKLDETKRIKSFLSPRRTTFDSVEFNNFLNENYNDAHGIPLNPDDPFYYKFDKYIRTSTSSDVKLVTPLFEDVNETDGFSILSLPAYREVKLKNGEWPDEAEAWKQWDDSYARQKLSKKGMYTYTSVVIEAKDKDVISKPKPVFKTEVLKPIVSGVKHNHNRIELTLDKYSQMSISYQAVEGTALESHYIKMMNEKIGYTIFESGRKMGIRGKHDLYNPDGTFNESPFDPSTIENVSWKSYGIQVENSYEDKEQTRGSQMTKLSSLDMFENGEEVIPGARKEYERNVKILNDMHRNAYVSLLNKLGVEDLGDSYKLIDPVSMSSSLQYELLRREAPENIKDIIRIDENGEFPIPFEASSNYRQIKDIIYSMIHKSLISPQMSGKPHVQVPVTLWENASEGRTLVRKIGDKYVKISRSQYNALSEEDKKSVRLTSDTLEFYKDEDGKRVCEIMLPHWFKDKLDRKKYPNDQAILNYLNNTKEGQKILSGIGFRIPTQAMPSIEVFKVKKFLDASMGSTVVVPSEITSKAGSDFDIDKLNMYLKSIYIDKNGDIRLVEYKGSEEKTKAFYTGVYEENIQNQLDKIENGDEFRDNLLEVFDIMESIEDYEEMTGEGLSFLLGEDLADFYDYNQYLIQEIIQQALDEEIKPSDYIGNQMGDLANKFDKLSKKLFNDKLKTDFINRMYKKSLENEYYDSLGKLISLPGNFQRLITPIGNAGLDIIAEKLDKIRGEREADVKNKLISSSFMTSLRHAFITGKKWVGIAAVNITGHSLTQKSKVFIDPSRFNLISEYDRKFLGDGSTFLPHNSIDGKISISGVKTADGKEYISDRLSGYATGFVDVSKDPYILKIVQSDLTVGIAMFMERMGAGETTAWFLNQPIIVDYITYLESIQSTSVFNGDNIAVIESKYSTEEDISSVEVDPSQFIDNIEKYYSGVEPSEMDNAIQRRIFTEFLKMAKMSQYSFSFSQGYNYDTTKFRDSDSFERKLVRTDVVRDVNIITSIDDVLNKSFIGEQRSFIEKGINSVGAIIKTEQIEFRNYLADIIKPFQQNQYLSGDKFEQIATRLKSSFLDFIIFTKNSKFQDVYASLLSGDNSTASKLPAIQEKYPNMKLLQDLRIESSQREGGAATIKLAVQARDAYDINLYTEMMRELRDLEPRFYKELVTLSVLQGSYNSAISIKPIIPFEDYSKIIKPIIDSLKPDESLSQFAKDGMFFRNNWRNEDIVPTANVRFFFPRRKGVFLTAEELQEASVVGVDQSGNEIYQYVSPMFPVMEGIQDKASTRQILTLSPMYDQRNGINNDFIKVAKLVKKDDGYINFFSGRTSTASMRAKALSKGDLSLFDYVGYKKVKYQNGDPVLTAKGEHIYKIVNLYGDGQYTIEYPISLSPSAFNNGSVKVEQEIPDAEIIRYFGGEPAIQEQVSVIPVEEVEEQNTLLIIEGEFSLLPDFTMEQKESILDNFASKYKMDRQKALNYINESLLTKDRENVIQKLKDCY